MVRLRIEKEQKKKELDLIAAEATVAVFPLSLCISIVCFKFIICRLNKQTRGEDAYR